MLKVINHEGDANQNHNEIPLDICQNRSHTKEKKQQVLVRIWREGNPYALLVRI